MTRQRQPKSRVIGDKVVSWLGGEAQELRDTARREIGEFRAGVDKVLSYLAWMVLLFVPGLIAGLLRKKGGVADGIEGYTYDSNPWEAMGYAAGGSHSPKVVLGIVWTVVLGVALVALFVLLSWKVIPWAWQ